MKGFLRSRTRSRRPAPRIGVERLEGRAVPAAAAATYDAGTLVVAFRPADPGALPVPRAVPVPAGQTVEQAVAGWQSTPGLAYAEPDHRYAVAAVPNDPSFGSQYAQNNTGQTGGTADADVDAPEAWDRATGSMTSVVAVVDTGVDYRHPDLYRNVWLNQDEIPAAVKAVLTDTDADGFITFRDLNAVVGGVKVNQGDGKITDLNGNGYIDGGDVLRPASAGGWADGVDAGPTGPDGGAYPDDLVGWDFANGDNDPFDDHGHGTHVAGTIGADGNNGVGVAGQAWRVQILAAKFLAANGSGSSSAGALAVRYAADAGAFASNNSWGDKWDSAAVRDAVAYAGTKGSVFVAAAGNSNTNIDTTPFYPAAYPDANLVSVAATNHTDGRASFSNYGLTRVDLGAPGVSIRSTLPGNRYGDLSGTSMAAPQVTGALALLRAADPSLTAAQAIARVLGTVDPVASMAGRTVTGGRLNLARAVDPFGPKVTALAANASGSDPVSAVRVTFSEAVAAASFTAADVAVAAPGGGAVAVTAVTPVGGDGTTWDVAFAPQSAAGSYSVTLGPDLTDTIGNRMDQDGDGVNGEAGQDAYAGGFTVDAPPSPPPPPAGPTAAFAGTDATTQGNWIGKYGATGYSLARGATLLPAGASLAFAGKTDHLWASSTADVRALRRATGTGRTAAAWISATNYSMTLTPADAAPHKVSLYLLDWNRSGRTETLEVVDAATGAVLDTRSASGFNNGVYYSWTVTGAVTFRVTRVTSTNALVSGLFID